MNDTYQPPVLTIDAVLFRVKDKLQVLLIQRKSEPFKDQWALPGGYNPEGETTRQAMERVLHKKAGVDTKHLKYIEQLYTFDTVARDPRGHAVSVTYMGLGSEIPIDAHKKVEAPKWHDIDSLPELAFDHEEIITYGHKRLKAKLQYTNAVFALLPDKFTLTDLQKTYEKVLGEKLDKRNFRKKFDALDLLEDTGEKRTGPHRPAVLYTFKTKGLVELEQFFST